MLKLAFNTLNHIDGRLGMTKGNHQSRKKSVKIPNNGLDRPPTEIDPFWTTPLCVWNFPHFSSTLMTSLIANDSNDVS